MKTLALIKRRADLTRDAFRDHYENGHAPLAIDTVLAGTSRYVRHHLCEEIFGSPAFDVVTSFWYPDVEAALGVQKRLQEPVGEAILRDEESFMDRPANTFFAVTERVMQGAEDREAGLSVVVLVRRPDGADAESFADDYETRALPRLLAAVGEPRWCLQQRALAMGPEAPAYDVATQVHATRDTGLAAWAGELSATGADVVVVRVSEHESDLPWV